MRNQSKKILKYFVTKVNFPYVLSFEQQTMGRRRPKPRTAAAMLTMVQRSVRAGSL